MKAVSRNRAAFTWLSSRRSITPLSPTKGIPDDQQDSPAACLPLWPLALPRSPWQCARRRRVASTDAFSDPTAIDNPYLPLSKFHRCTYRGEEDGERLRIKRTVLDRTRTFVVDGVAVETMVVKDRVHADGELIEDTRDFFAQDDTGAVRYFGERVDNLRDGGVINHSGSWLFGRDTDEIGVLMAANPHVGSHWLSEDAAPITVEHDRVVDELHGPYSGQAVLPRDRRSRVRASRPRGRAQALSQGRRRDRRTAA